MLKVNRNEKNKCTGVVTKLLFLISVYEFLLRGLFCIKLCLALVRKISLVIIILFI